MEGEENSAATFTRTPTMALFLRRTDPLLVERLKSADAVLIRARAPEREQRRRHAWLHSAIDEHEPWAPDLKVRQGGSSAIVVFTMR